MKLLSIEVRMKISNVTLSRFILFLIVLWSAWNLTQPLNNFLMVTYMFLLLPVSTLLIGLTFLQEDKDDNDFGGGIMIPIDLKDRI